FDAGAEAAVVAAAVGGAPEGGDGDGGADASQAVLDHQVERIAHAAVGGGLDDHGGDGRLGLITEEAGHRLEDGLLGGALGAVADLGDPIGDGGVERSAAAGELVDELLEEADALRGGGAEVLADARTLRGV